VRANSWRNTANLRYVGPRRAVRGTWRRMTASAAAAQLAREIAGGHSPGRSPPGSLRPAGRSRQGSRGGGGLGGSRRDPRVPRSLAASDYGQLRLVLVAPAEDAPLRGEALAAVPGARPAGPSRRDGCPRRVQRGLRVRRARRRGFSSSAPGARRGGEGPPVPTRARGAARPAGGRARAQDPLGSSAATWSGRSGCTSGRSPRPSRTSGPGRAAARSRSRGRWTTP